MKTAIMGRISLGKKQEVLKVKSNNFFPFCYSSLLIQLQDIAYFFRSLYQCACKEERLHLKSKFYLSNYYESRQKTPPNANIRIITPQIELDNQREHQERITLAVIKSYIYTHIRTPRHTQSKVVKVIKSLLGEGDMRFYISSFAL